MSAESIPVRSSVVTRKFGQGGKSEERRFRWSKLATGGGGVVLIPEARGYRIPSRSRFSGAFSAKPSKMREVRIREGQDRLLFSMRFVCFLRKSPVRHIRFVCMISEREHDQSSHQSGSKQRRLRVTEEDSNGMRPPDQKPTNNNQGPRFNRP